MAIYERMSGKIGDRWVYRDFMCGFTLPGGSGAAGLGAEFWIYDVSGRMRVALC